MNAASPMGSIAPVPDNLSYEESDFGRRFGWFIEKAGIVVGELDYLRWDSDMQFWHEYQVRWHQPEEAVVGPDAWIASQLVLRSRRYPGVVAVNFLTGCERGNGILPVRNAWVPEEHATGNPLANNQQ